MLKRWAIVFLFFVLWAQITPCAGKENNLPEYAPGELIVKFKGPMADTIVEGLLKKTEINDGILAGESFLKDLNIRYHAESIEPLFKSLRHNGKLIRSIDRAKMTRKKLLGMKKFSGKRRQMLLNVQNLDPAAKLENIYKISFDKDVDIKSIATEFSNNPHVEYAHPNYIFQPNADTSDPRYSEQWMHAKISSISAWDNNIKGKNVVVAIVDSGVDYTHEDLRTNIGSNIGYDFNDDDSDPSPYIQPDTGALDGHGTFCAGIVAAAANGTGVIGIAPEATILPIKAKGDAQANFTVEVLEPAWHYAVDEGADILNNSFGILGKYENFKDAFQDIITDIKNNNPSVIFIASAGNDNTGDSYYPANYNGVISVAATMPNDARRSTSNFGEGVDVAAPGDAILSTIPGGYIAWGGTSAAAPVISGVAALILSKNPSLTSEEVEQIIVHGVDRFGMEIPAPDQYIGLGRTNIAKVLEIMDLDWSGHRGFIDSVTAGLVAGVKRIAFRAKGISAEYILEYGPGIYPSSWTTIDRGSLTSSNLVSLNARLDTSQFASGRYTIRLKVIWREAGKEREAIDTIRMDIDNESPANGCG